MVETRYAHAEFPRHVVNPQRLIELLTDMGDCSGDAVGMPALDQRGVLRAQVALAWLLQKEPVVAPIIGATRPSHLEDAVGALAIQLTPEEIAFMEEPYVPHRVVGPNPDEPEPNRLLPRITRISLIFCHFVLIRAIRGRRIAALRACLKIAASVQLSWHNAERWNRLAHQIKALWASTGFSRAL